MSFASVFLPNGISPKSVEVKRDEQGTLIGMVDGIGYQCGENSTIGTKAIYKYNSFGQLEFVGLTDQQYEIYVDGGEKQLQLSSDKPSTDAKPAM